MPTKSWRDTVAIVTGGARGVGFAVGSELIARGACVCLVDLSQEALDTAARTLPGAQVMTKALDVSDAASVTAAVAAVAGVEAEDLFMVVDQRVDWLRLPQQL